MKSLSFYKRRFVYINTESYTLIDANIEENYRKHITVDGQPSIVNIIDTAGQHEYTALRDQHLKDGKGFLLVFALNDKSSYEEMQLLKDQIIKLKDTKKVPFVICANKCVNHDTISIIESFH